MSQTTEIDNITISMSELSILCNGVKSYQEIKDRLKMTRYTNAHTQIRLSITIALRQRLNWSDSINKLFIHSEPTIDYVKARSTLDSKVAKAWVSQSVFPPGDLGKICSITQELLLNPSKGTPEYRDKIAEIWLHQDPEHLAPSYIQLYEEDESELESELETLQALLKKESDEVSQHHLWIAELFCLRESYPKHKTKSTNNTSKIHNLLPFPRF